MILILNNKANLNIEEVKYYEKHIRKYNLIVLPAYCYLPLFKKGNYILGSQDISEFIELNRTGEVNGLQLKSLNVKYTLIGHSERRLYNKEDNIKILNKIDRCYENGITPMYCIGEVNNHNYDDLISQIDLVENRLKDKEIIYIYEPPKNIGNINPNLEDIQNKVNFIKDYIKDKYNKDITLIYGGGVNINNIEYIKNIKNIDGIIISTESFNLKHLKYLYNVTRK